MGFWSFCLFTVSMEMRDDVIQQKQKQYAAPESDHGRGEGESPHPGGLFNGRDQQAHTEAATMTPAAKPVRARCKDSLNAFFRKNTHAAPSVVPRKGIKMP